MLLLLLPSQLSLLLLLLFLLFFFYYCYRYNYYYHFHYNNCMYYYYYFFIIIDIIICFKDQIKDLGPVVQSIVSLTSSLRGQLIKSFRTLLPNTLILFIEKMRKVIFQQKILAYIKMFKILTNR